MASFESTQKHLILISYESWQGVHRHYFNHYSLYVLMSSMTEISLNFHKLAFLLRVVLVYMNNLGIYIGICR
jgi:hypothetical protein